MSKLINKQQKQTMDKLTEHEKELLIYFLENFELPPEENSTEYLEGFYINDNHCLINENDCAVFDDSEIIRLTRKLREFTERQIPALFKLV